MSLSSSKTNTNSKCAACGKEGDDLKVCTACHMVKYCNRDCQISHRKQHKKACKKRAAELYDEKLFKEVEPEECPICFLPMPIKADETTFESCCGKSICNGCIYAMIMSEGKDLCAFCRTPNASSDEEHINRTKKLIDNGNAGAMHLLAGIYDQGLYGMPQDNQKAYALYLKAGEQGSADAYSRLGILYRLGTGVERDMKKAQHYWQLAAMMGDVDARCNLGVLEWNAGNYIRAFKHYTLAARVGSKDALDEVKNGFVKGLVTKDEYASTLRAHQQRLNEMKSDEMDKAASERIRN